MILRGLAWTGMIVLLVAAFTPGVSPDLMMLGSVLDVILLIVGVAPYTDNAGDIHAITGSPPAWRGWPVTVPARLSLRVSPVENEVGRRGTGRVATAVPREA